MKSNKVKWGEWERKCLYYENNINKDSKYYDIVWVLYFENTNIPLLINYIDNKEFILLRHESNFFGLREQLIADYYGFSKV